MEAHSTAKKPWDRPRAHRRNYISQPNFVQLGIPQEELDKDISVDLCLILLVPGIGGNTDFFPPTQIHM